MPINMTQEFEFETDEFKSFSVMLRAAIDTMFRDNSAGGSEYSQLYVSTKEPDFWQDGSIESETKRIPPSRLFVCLIGNYHDDIKKGDYRARTVTGAASVALEKVLQSVNRESVDQIRNPFEDIDDQGFGEGYRVHWQSSCGWDQLIVSRVWVYYSK